MKKILALILIVAMVCSLSGCGIVGKILNKYINEPQSDINYEINELVEATEVSETQAEEKTFSLGTISGTTYESEFLSLGCSLSGDWTFYTDEEIKELNNMATDLAGEEYEKLMEQSTIVYDMMASSNDQLSSVNIVLEKSNEIAVSSFDLEKNGEIIALSARSSLENMGFTEVKSNVTTTEFLGSETQCLKWDMKMGTVDYYEIQVFVKAYDYLATITVASDKISTCEELLDSFYEL